MGKDETMSTSEKQHHPWCNFGPASGPVESCKMCERFFRLYPFKEGDDPNELVTDHFPNVQVRR
jgi:hypothetical protein